MSGKIPKSFINKAVFTYVKQNLICQKYGVNMTEFTLTKQISKQGKQTMLIIPTFLREKLRAGTVVEVKIRVLESELS